MTDEKEVADFQKRLKREKLISDLKIGLARPFNAPKQAKMSLQEVKEKFGLPRTLATPYAEKTMRNVLAQDSSYGGYDLMWNGLTTHAVFEGQFPMSGFVGYPVLQNISGGF